MIVMIIIVILEVVAGLLAFAFWPEVYITDFESLNLKYKLSSPLLNNKLHLNVLFVPVCFVDGYPSVSDKSISRTKPW